MATAAGPRLGPDDAPVILLLYSDYRCSFCRDFDRKLRIVRMRYPEHLAVVVKPFIVLDTSEDTRLFLAAECAREQDVFEAFHNATMEMAGNEHGLPHWTVVADSVGVHDREGFNRCVRTAEYADRIQAAHSEGVAFGVQAVPTFIINGYIYEGSLPLSALDSAIVRAMPRSVMVPEEG